MPHKLLKKNVLPLDIEIHSDPLCILPCALSKQRAFKQNKIIQEEMQDNVGGASKCVICNPDLLDGKPNLTFHLDKKVLSFPNAAPFMPGDQRVICLWHDSHEKRYAYSHNFKFNNFDGVEFYCLSKVAVELAKEFPNTADGIQLQEDINLIRCIAGFNIGRLAGQSIPHFHLQYGWEILLDPRNINLPTLDLYFWEMKDEHLILYEDERKEFYLVVPWAPKGQFHVEIHFRNKYQLCELDDKDLNRITYFAIKILDHYKSIGIQNINILFTGSPQGKHWEPLRIQFVPRVNITALYEMIGVNVVDTPPERISAFFTSIRWSDVDRESKSFTAEDLYRLRFG